MLVEVSLACTLTSHAHGSLLKSSFQSAGKRALGFVKFWHDAYDCQRQAWQTVLAPSTKRSTQCTPVQQRASPVGPTRHNRLSTPLSLAATSKETIPSDTANVSTKFQQAHTGLHWGLSSQEPRRRSPGLSWVRACLRSLKLQPVQRGQL